jgi:hypothetical protein
VLFHHFAPPLDSEHKNTAPDRLSKAQWSQ